MTTSSSSWALCKRSLSAPPEKLSESSPTILFISLDVDRRKRHLGGLWFFREEILLNEGLPIGLHIHLEKRSLTWSLTQVVNCQLCILCTCFNIYETNSHIFYKLKQRTAQRVYSFGYNTLLPINRHRLEWWWFHDEENTDGCRLTIPPPSEPIWLPKLSKVWKDTCNKV